MRSVRICRPIIEGVYVDTIISSAIGAGGIPAVVFPSVNMTITLALEEDGSNKDIAVEKASAWLVAPPAESELTADFKSETDVIS